VLVFVAIRVIKALVWSGTAAAPQGFLGHLMVWGSITWIVLIPWAVADLFGWMIFRRHSPASDGYTGSPIDHTVAFRIVTRGDQPRVVCETAHVILDTMAGRPLFPYSLEVVSDVPIANLPEHHSVRPLVVPDGYATGNGATHKARALQYALEHSPLPDDAWILHLDEESHITPEVVEGIRDAVAAEEASGELRVGQGLILYDRNIENNTFLTLADSIRVADDMGRFYLQYRLNRVLFGMHGSFVLVRSDVEQRIGWDFPPDACVTEDTTWALMQMDAGTRFRWVDGTVVEQAPQTPMDFVKQRRRWFGGMWWGALRAPARLAYRSMLIMAMFIWSFGWLNLLFSYTHLFSGVLIPTPIAILGDLVFATYITNYLIGLWGELDEPAPAVARADQVRDPAGGSAPGLHRLGGRRRGVCAGKAGEGLPRRPQDLAYVHGSLIRVPTVGSQLHHVYWGTLGSQQRDRAAPKGRPVSHVAEASG
jgi:egghead protein (zeste-white 4 protein)